MKKFSVLVFTLVVLMCASSSYAQQSFALGEGNLALKVDWIHFTDDAFDSVDLDNGIYLGLEGYWGIAPNWYIGGEIGWAYTSNDGRRTWPDGRTQEIDLTVNYVPIELNLKYAVEVAPNWVVGLGGGLSYNWFDLDVEVGGRGADIGNDWVFGVQVFGDINYVIDDSWFIGVNAKYQWTDDIELKVRGERMDSDVSAGNFRLGLQVGFLF